MSLVPTSQVYQLARGAGLGHSAAITATAIAIGESGRNPDAVGDTTLTDATWGPSIGLWQIRSVKAESGTGRDRDATRLRSPSFNAASMASISNGGTNWEPWSVYKSGVYKSYLPQVHEEIGAGAPVAPNVGTSPVGHNVPGIPGIPDPGDLLDIGGDLIGDGASGVAANVVGLLVKELAPAVLIGVGVVGGFAIIAVGAWRGSDTKAAA